MSYFSKVLEEIIKHMPGQHDQNNHAGRDYKKEDNQAKGETELTDIVNAWYQAFGFEDSGIEYDYPNDSLVINVPKIGGEEDLPFDCATATKGALDSLKEEHIFDKIRDKIGGANVDVIHDYEDSTVMRGRFSGNYSVKDIVNFLGQQELSSRKQSNDYQDLTERTRQSSKIINRN